MEHTKPYDSDGIVAVGDLVEVVPGAAYSTGIVTKKWTAGDPLAKRPEEWVLIERVHCSCSQNGQLQIGIEHVDLPVKRVLELRAYVTGASGSVDNRKR